MSIIPLRTHFLRFAVSSYGLVLFNVTPILQGYLDGLVQERCNSSALAMQLRLSGINPSISSTLEYC